MMRGCLLVLAVSFVAQSLSAAQEQHDHPAPEKLGAVSFATSCKPGTQAEFNRAVALLHSFAYKAAEEAFRGVAGQDPGCGIAHWGIAMTGFHQLWEPHLSPAGLALIETEIGQASGIAGGTERERGFIDALGMLAARSTEDSYSTRALRYEDAMTKLAAAHREDVEAQVFYALALLSNASPADKAHEKQKQAAALLEPLYARFPEHPGIPHYLIHAYDNAELAAKGLAAARAYSKIAPSAPHALHMPSHIFTRLGLWDDCIASNVAARSAARAQGDTGEELHAMDYLVYAYLQSGHDAEAAAVIKDLREMPALNSGDFKVGYAATAMPVRYAIERRDWKGAESIVAPADSALPQVAAVAVWARGMGLVHDGHLAEGREQIERLLQIEEQLRQARNDYWAGQTGILKRQVAAWAAQAGNRPDEAVALMRGAADDEDAVEKLPATPGPIVPAREQLGDLLLEQGHSNAALKEFETALGNAPGRRGAMLGRARAAGFGK